MNKALCINYSVVYFSDENIENDNIFYSYIENIIKYLNISTTSMRTMCATITGMC